MALEPNPHADHNQHPNPHLHPDTNDHGNQHAHPNPNANANFHSDQFFNPEPHADIDFHIDIHADDHAIIYGCAFRNSSHTIGHPGGRDRISHVFSLKGLCISCLAALLLLSACTTPTNSQATPFSTSAAGGQEATDTANEAEIDSGAVTLNVWFPPNFDPNGGGLAASMLQTRLNEFDAQHPGLRVVVRIKSEQGSGGLLASLLAAQNAAPLALPDLALMPSTLVPLAAQSLLISPVETSSLTSQPDDWYPVAQEMVAWEGQSYGVPFAADALVLAFRPTAVNSVPVRWDTVLANQRILGFAAGDPLALFTLFQSLSLENDADDSGIPISDESMQTVFEFYSAGNENGVFPFWLTQYQNTEQSWQSFSEGLVPMVVAWSSRVMTSQADAISGAPLPTRSGQPFTLVSGWVWTITSPNEQRAALAGELAEFLSTPEFMAQWSAAAGLLPLRQSSLAAWSPDERQALASQIIGNASTLPDQDTLELWGNALSQAVIGLLKDEINVAEALQVVNGLLADG